MDVMISRYPLHSSREAEIERLLPVYASVIDDRQAFYVSAAITTGRRYVEWRRSDAYVADEASPAYRAALHHHVIGPNIAASRAIVAELRHRRGVVIDPAGLPDVPGWSQPDYHVFWGRVIERFVGVVVFAPSWEYSNGCGYEFMVAQSCGCVTLDAQQRPLGRVRGRELIQHAIAEMQESGLATDFLQGVVRDLERIVSSEARGA